MGYTTVIGLEVHVQLLTNSKLFCGCVNRFNPDEPNSQTCPVCLGLPGALPVMNEHAFKLGVKTALGLSCNIPSFTKWDRKQYYYPDLPKAYQISQYDLPFSEDGVFEIETNSETGETKKIGIIRAHLEEDAGKNIHDEKGRGNDSQVDLNRCGTPLVEIVTQPDLRSAKDAHIFLEELRTMLTYLEVSDCNMQEGSLRCDANINLHVETDDGHVIATPIIEIKNMNSFRAVEIALEYEEKRQYEVWKKTGNTLEGSSKQTRGWDANREITFAQREKEDVSDYRYLPDPDLVPVIVEEEFVQSIRDEMCELPADRRKRLQAMYQLSNYDIGVVINQGPEFANYFETVAKGCGDGKQATNWVTQDILREMNERSVGINEFPIKPPVLAALLTKIVAKEISVTSAREIFNTLLTDAAGGDMPIIEHIDEIIKEKGLAMVSDTGQLDGVIETILANNQKIADDFRGGKQGAIGPLIGQVMKEVKGADPKTVRQMIIEKLSS